MNAGDRFGLERFWMFGEERRNQPVWLDDGGLYRWEDLVIKADGYRRLAQSVGIGPGQVVVTPGEQAFDSVACFFGMVATGAVVAPLRRERQGEIEGWKEFLRVDWTVEGGQVWRCGRGRTSETARGMLETLAGRKHAGLMLATGGTTGPAKIILHDLEVLLDSVPVKAGRTWRTLPLMRFDHIGGLDMVFRALATGQILLTPPREFGVESVAATVERHRAEVMPATPSFLNLMLMSGVAQRYDLGSLQTIPYGAEPMPAGLLERLKAALPKVVFVQRFGTSETGTMPVKSEGDALRLETRDGYAWKVERGELWLKSPTLGLGYLQGGDHLDGDRGWFPTGDLAEERPDGTIRVLGRRAELINVGGEKVMPSQVEAVLLRHPMVADCRVKAVGNAVLGQVVGAELVWKGAERDRLAVKRSVHAFATSSLPKSHLPAVVWLVDAVETTRNFKKIRGELS